MNPQTDHAAAQRAGEASNSFAANLFRRATDEAGPARNVFVSSFSVAAALALALEGAQGDTAAEMKLALGYSPDHDAQQMHHDLASLMHALNKMNGVELSVANALWLSDRLDFHADFVKRARELLSEARTVDFSDKVEESRQTINSWVEDKTKDKIKDLLPEGSLVPGNCQLVITNAIYFKGSWQHPFEEKHTQDQDFHLLGNSGVKRVKMMKQNELETPHRRFDDHAMVQLPYEGEDVVMLVLLPHENSAAALQALVSEDNMKKIDDNQRRLRASEVDIKLPRFKFEHELELSGILKDMGVQKPFSDDEADFSGMVASEELRIGRVFHKAFVEVNEEGTEAAAATSMLMSNCYKPRVDFVVDRPFVFVIYSTSLRCPLFTGKVVEV